MADLERGPPKVEYSCEYCVKGVHTGYVLGAKATPQRNVAHHDQNQTYNVPWLSLADPCIEFVAQHSHNGGCQSVAYLAREESSRSRFGDDDFIEEVEEVIEPASCHQIVDKVTDTISPDMDP